MVFNKWLQSRKEENDQKNVQALDAYMTQIGEDQKERNSLENIQLKLNSEKSLSQLKSHLKAKQDVILSGSQKREQLVLKEGELLLLRTEVRHLKLKVEKFKKTDLQKTLDEKELELANLEAEFKKLQME